MPSGRWIWLFPFTYAAHVGEELWCGPGFAAWFNEHTNSHFTTNELVLANGIGMIAMIAGGILTSRSHKWRWVLTTLGTIVVINAIMHGIASAWTQSYSPGLYSGLFLWLPLGTLTLVREWRTAQRSTFTKGLVAAAVFHVFLAAAALYTGSSSTGGI